MQYLYAVSAFMLPLAWIFIYRNGMQGLGQSLVPMLSGVIELVCRYIVILLAAKPFGYPGVCFADPVTWMITGIILLITYLFWKQKTKKGL